MTLIRYQATEFMVLTANVTISVVQDIKIYYVEVRFHLKIQ